MTAASNRPVALVTGASSGIGLAMALELAGENHAVALVARRKDELEKAARAVHAAGGEAHVAPADVTDASAMEIVVAEVVAKYGRLDVFAGAAGVGAATPGGAFDIAVAQGIIDANITGFVSSLAAALPPMIERKSGRVIAFSSLAGYRGLSGNAAYCASKAFVRLLAESLRVDLRKKGISVTTACPGWVRTPMIDGNSADMKSVLDADETAREIWRAAKKGRSIIDLPAGLGLATRAGAHMPDFAFDLTMGGRTWPFAAASDVNKSARPQKAPKGRPAALVTGASTGIGKSLCLELAGRGWDLAMIARREEVLEAAAGEARSAGATVYTYPIDVTIDSDLRNVYADFLKRTGRLDMAVANAGFGVPTPGGAFKFDAAKKMIDLNISAFTATIAHALPTLRGQGFGRLVGLSSLAAIRGLPTAGIYCASKAFVAAFLESLRADLRPWGVTTTTVFPGFVKTPGTDKNSNPMPFLMKPEDAARRIAGAAIRGRSRVAFPWPMVAALGLGKLLPDPVYDRAVGGRKR